MAFATQGTFLCFEMRFWLPISRNISFGGGQILKSPLGLLLRQLPSLFPPNTAEAVGVEEGHGKSP